MKPTAQGILAQLAQIIHPEFDKNIVELGMITNIDIVDNNISFALLFKRQHDPFSASISQKCRQILNNNFPDANVKITQMPARQPEQVKQNTAEQKKNYALHNVQHTVAVASGKGGVGKSTIATNLAVSLANMGFKTGLVDADIYGPSIPKMFGIENAQPAMVRIENMDFIEPVERYGVKIISVGFFVDPADALIWRAPMVTNALRQLACETHWGELDFLLIDLPPGTGDVHLTTVQNMKLDGAIIVTTPQPVALADAVKGINMFRQEKIKVPILGLVENMAWFTPEELPENRYYIFGKDGGMELAKKMQVPLLAQIPIVQSVRQGGDDGMPAALKNSVQSKIFDEFANSFIKQIKQNMNIKLS